MPAAQILLAPRYSVGLLYNVVLRHRHQPTVNDALGTARISMLGLGLYLRFISGCTSLCAMMADIPEVADVAGPYAFTLTISAFRGLKTD